MEHENEQETNLALSLSLSTINTSNNIYTEKCFYPIEIQKDISTPSRENEQDITDEDQCNASKKKLRLTEEQYNVLEHSFKKHVTLNAQRKEFLAKELNLQPRQVEVWFQNRRARTKLKETEMNFELMRRYCDELTKENKRMQKELQHLKALKAVHKSPIHNMQQPAEATDLYKMCPSCMKIFTAGFRPNWEPIRSEPRP